MDRTSNCRKLVAQECLIRGSSPGAIGKTVENYVEQSQFWIEERLEHYDSAIRRGAVTAGNHGDACTDRTPIPGSQNPSLRYLTTRAARPAVINIQDNLDNVHMGDRRRLLCVPAHPRPTCRSSLQWKDRARQIQLRCVAEEQARDAQIRIGGAVRPDRVGNVRAAAICGATKMSLGQPMRRTDPGAQTRASRRVRRPVRSVAGGSYRLAPMKQTEPLPGQLHPPSIQFKNTLFPLPRWCPPPPCERM